MFPRNSVRNFARKLRGKHVKNVPKPLTEAPPEKVKIANTLRPSIIAPGALIIRTAVLLVVLVYTGFCSPGDGFLVLVAVVAFHYGY